MTQFVEVAALLERFFKENQIDNAVSVTLKFVDNRDKHYTLYALHREMNQMLLTTGSLVPQDFESFTMLGIKWRLQDE